MADSNPIPTDMFSRTLRAAQDNPSMLGACSTVHSRDFYGNTETWVVETYRFEDGWDVVFVQRNGAEGGTRFVIPADVTAALARHRDQLAVKARRRAARKAVETRRLRGDAIGNPEALRKARKQKQQTGGTRG